MTTSDEAIDDDDEHLHHRLNGFDVVVRRILTTRCFLNAATIHRCVPKDAFGEYEPIERVLQALDHLVANGDALTLTQGGEQRWRLVNQKPQR